MRTAARNGGMLQLHCEEPGIIDPLVGEALARGDVGCRHHALTRPAHAEGAATRRAIEMARRADAPLYIVHLSCGEALDAVAEAKDRGEPVYAETCPHYLTFTDELYADDDEAEVIKRVISPPLRTRADVDALWAGLARRGARHRGQRPCPRSARYREACAGATVSADQQRRAGHRDAAERRVLARGWRRVASASSAWSRCSRRRRHASSDCRRRARSRLDAMPTSCSWIPE